MSKKKIQEGILAEGVLDTIFKTVVGTYFGSKMIDNHTKKMAMKDPEIQKQLKDIKSNLADVNKRIAKLKAMSA